MDFIKKTKIVATLGPSSSKSKIIEKMILEGVNVFRINFSHADYNLVKEKIKIIRSLDKKLKTNSSILGDLQGPKIRLGKIEENSKVLAGEEYNFYTNKEFIGNKKKGYINYNQFAKDLSKGENILIDDGKLIFKVISSDKKSIVKTKVIQGGLLNSNKGVNLPNTKISLPALTKKDLDDAKFIFKNDFDWIALSFVRTKNDIIGLKKLMKKFSDHEIPIIAKIEKPEAINNIEEIFIESHDHIEFIGFNTLPINSQIQLNISNPEKVLMAGDLLKIDFEKVFEGLLDAIESSKLGSMLVMFGGRKALLPLKQPIIEKLKLIINEKLNEVFSQSSNESLVTAFKSNIEKAIDSKLSELKPDDIKKIVETMIREHLGWLIVWGGVFGGLFGFMFSIIQTYYI